MNKYFYIDKTTNQQCGPFSVNDLKTKNINSDTMVWCSGMTNWTIAGNVAELSVLFGYSQSNPVSPNYGNTTVQSPVQQRSNIYDNNVYGYGRQKMVNDGNNFKNIYPMPKTWFVESILVTIFCSIIFGIIAIVKASKVESLYYAGDYGSAEQASKDAKKWIIIGVSLKAILFLFIIVYFLICFVFIGAASYSKYN